MARNATNLIISACMALFFLVTCQGLARDVALAAQQAPEFTTEALTIAGKDGTVHPFTVELAADEAQREYGLMFRAEMAADHGMLFVFDAPQHVQMWMENTVLPLDMLFLNTSGTVTRIVENAVPYSKTIIDSGGTVKYVIELNAGIVKKLGLAVGDKVTSPTIGKH